MIEEEPILFYRKAPGEVDHVFIETTESSEKKDGQKLEESPEVQRARLIVAEYRELDFDYITVALTQEYNAAIRFLVSNNVDPFPDHSPIAGGVSAPFEEHEY